jgi:signal transduction histidine kinase
VTLRQKLLIIFIGLGVVPALVAGIVNHVSRTRAIESQLRADAEDRATRMASKVESLISSHEKQLLALAGEESIRTFVRGSETPTQDVADQSGVPAAVRAHVAAFFANSRGQFEAISCLGPGARPLFRFSTGGGAAHGFQTQDFVAASVRADDRVWQTEQAQCFRSQLAQEPYGISLRTTVPVLTIDAGGRAQGALVLEMKLKEVLKEAAELADGSRPSTDGAAIIIALDNSTGRIVFHTNDAFKYQPVSAVMPYFDSVAGPMRSGKEGVESFRSPEGDEWIAGFKQASGSNLSLAVAENYSAASAEIWMMSALVVALSLVAGALAVVLLSMIARQTTGRIHQVAAGAAAIARGDLDHRIDLDAGGETGALVESFNRMSDRLRELIRREAESKQFDSFMRLSAMLTHDLKNAITGLSMLVSNMERHLHREEFREDAVFSLRQATDKLKRIVSRLNEPAKSFSGEYRRDARPTDLVPIIRRVLATNAEPSAPLYEIETLLPESLIAIAEADRIENVIENLVINALEAMGSAGGRLTVEAGEEENNLIFFSVADTGAGMNEEFIKLRLFRPFSTTKQKGIGLGLFTCREIVEAHGGRLEVESKPGAGTRFRVVLPSRLFASGERSRRSSEGAIERSSRPFEPGR